MISKEFDKEGIPIAHVNAFSSIALSAGANRIITGGDFTCPIGDPELPPEREKDYMRNILLKALEAIATDVSGPTIFSVRKGEGKEAK